MANSLQENTIDKLVLSEFWTNRIKNMRPIQLGFPTVSSTKDEESKIRRSLSEESREQFLLVTKGKAINTYKIGLAALYVLLKRYSKESELTVASPLPQFDQLSGVENDFMFVTANVSDDDTVKSLLGQIHIDFMNGLQHADHDVLELSKNLGSIMSRVGFYSDGFTRDVQLSTISAMNFGIVETEDDLKIELSWNEENIAKEYAEQLHVHYQRVIEVIIANLDIQLNDVKFVHEKEVITPLNSIPLTDPIDFNFGFVQRIEQIVVSNPEAIAINHEGKELSYKDLNTRANKLSHYLLSQGLKPKDRVAVVGGRSLDLTIRVLAVLKSGCAYVPIDSDFPLERKKEILKSSECHFLLIDKNDIDQELSSVIQLVTEEEAEASDSNNPGIIADPEDLLYIMFSSGTTGKPKGIMVNHKSILNLLLWYEKKYKIDENTRTLQLTNLIIDIAFQEIFSSLLVGAILYIPSTETSLDKAAFIDYLNTNKITFIQVIPDLLKTYFQEGEKVESLAYVLCGGDKLNDLLRDRIIKKGYNLYDVYGQTETAIDSVISNCTEGLAFDEAIQGYDIYVLDDALNYVLPGTVGQICTGGIGLGIGYLNDPEQTQEKFIDNPHAEGKLYLTGDLGRKMPDGTIQFIGREDNQVKIRGYRTELSEVEKVLLKHPSVDDSVVVAFTNAFNDKNLVGYLIANDELKSAELRSFMKEIVPDYMIPTYFIQLDRFPISTNGKVDKKALPHPEVDGTEREEAYKAPESPQEIAVVNALQNVLKRDHIGINDNFYDLGGDSIKCILIVSKLKQEGFDLKVEDVLKNPVLIDLAAILQKNELSIDQSEVTGDHVLGPVQRFFFEDKGMVVREHYNQSILLKMKSVNAIHLEQAFLQLTRHHDVLRSTFNDINGEWMQRTNGTNEKYFSIDEFDLMDSDDTSLQITKHCEELQSSIDISQGPLVKIGIFQCEDGDRILIAIHHLLIDGVSWRIILEDLATSLMQLSSNKQIKFPLKTDAFKKWSEEQSSYFLNRNAEKEYWLAISEGNYDTLSDSDNNVGHYFVDGHATFSLGPEDTERALSSVHTAFGTNINDVLLTGLALALKETLSVERTLIRMEGHGREEIFDGVDVSRTVGWFTSIFPSVLDISGSKTPIEALIGIKDETRKVPNKGIGYGILKFIEKEEDLKQTPWIEFNYLGSFEQLESDVPFVLGKEDAGNQTSLKNKSETSLNIHGIHMNGALTISCDFAKEIFSDQIIEDLIRNFENSLISLLNALENESAKQLTVSDLSFSALTMNELKVINKSNTLEDVYPLSPLQEGMYYHWSLSPDHTQYVNQTSYRIRGKQDLGLLEESYSQLVNRHGALRTSFTQQFAGTILQIVRNSVTPVFSFIDGKGAEFDLEEFKKADWKKGFHLSGESLMRLTIVELNEERYEFIWSSHHILMDGWCVSVLINDFFEILNAVRLGSTLNNPTPKPYSNYINWISELEEEHSLSYWEGVLDEVNETAIVPTQQVDLTKPFTEQQNTMVIDGEQFSALNQFCRKSSITLNSYVQGVWGYLLANYNYTNDVVFGSVVSGRPATLDGADEMIGLFINTIPVRVKFDENDSPKSLLERVHKQSIDGNDHHYLNLSEVQSQSALGMDLIDHIMVFENFAVKETSEELEMQLSVESMDVQEHTNYDFNLIIGPGAESLSIQIKYNTEHYTTEFIQDTLERFVHLMVEFTERSNAKLSEISCMSTADGTALQEFETYQYADFPKELTITGAFNIQVQNNPNSIALSFKEKSLTYEELDQQSNQLAHYLNSKFNIQSEELIAVKLDRSERMIITLLAILKTGAAYVPIDPSYPTDRIDFIEKDTNCRVSIDEVFLNSFENEKHAYSSDEVRAKLKGTDLAYIIYTSGTTGTPKGMQIEHSNVIQLLFNEDTPFDFRSDDVWTLFHSYCFDFSVWEMYGSLLFGGELVIVPEGITKDVEAFSDLIVSKEVTVLNQTPSVFKVLQEHVIDQDKVVKTRYVIFGGEALHPEFLANWNNRFKSCRLINMYGITETTVHVTYKEIRESDIKKNTSNIGKALPTLECHIVGQNRQSVPIGIPGELYVSGWGVGRGYLNQPELTSDRFLEKKVNGKIIRLYRSGDLVRRLSSGDLEYLGRIDDQVKVRGYRIELGEVVDALQKHSKIKDAVVCALGDGSNKFLYGYYIAEAEISEDELFQSMKELLPSYMIPSGFKWMDSFPITKNGKLNKKELPQPNFQSSVEYVPPSNELEEKLIEIWAELLKENPENIGLNHHFFDAGANSLSVTKLSLKVKSELKCEFALVDIFERPILKDQATFISNKIWLTEDIEEDMNLNEFEI